MTELLGFNIGNWSVGSYMPDPQFLLLGIAFLLIAVFVIDGIKTLYHVIIKYDTNNGTRYKRDQIKIKKLKNGDTFHWLKRSKEIVNTEINDENITYGKWDTLIGAVFSFGQKPLIELYKDREGNYHQVKFINKRPIYDKNGNIIKYVPLIYPEQSREGKKIFMRFAKGINETWKNIDAYQKLAIPAIIITGIIVMGFLLATQ